MKRIKNKLLYFILISYSAIVNYMGIYIVIQTFKEEQFITTLFILLLLGIFNFNSLDIKKDEE